MSSTRHRESDDPVDTDGRQEQRKPPEARENRVQNPHPHEELRHELVHRLKLVGRELGIDLPEAVSCRTCERQGIGLTLKGDSNRPSRRLRLRNVNDRLRDVGVESEDILPNVGDEANDLPALFL